MAREIQKSKQTVRQSVVRNLKHGCKGAVDSARIGIPGALRILRNFPTDLAKSFIGNGKEKTKSEMN